MKRLAFEALCCFAVGSNNVRNSHVVLSFIVGRAASGFKLLNHHTGKKGYDSDKQYRE